MTQVHVFVFVLCFHILRSLPAGMVHYTQLCDRSVTANGHFLFDDDI